MSESEQKIIQLLEDGGVTKVILEAPTGEESPIDGQEVDVTYLGTLENGEEFDKNVDEDDPFQFFVGSDNIIKGWSVALLSMKKGEKSRFTIKADYAYGEAGSPPKIPGGATLIFEIKLIDFRDKQPSKWDYAPEERVPLAEGFKQEGNAAFKAGNLEEAVEHYLKAIDYIDIVRSVQINTLFLSLHLNMSLIRFKQGDFKEAWSFAQKAVEKEPTVKGYFRLGNALVAQSEFKLAVDAFKKGLEIEPTSKPIKKALFEARKEVKRLNNQQKNMFQQFFSNNEMYDPLQEKPTAEYHNEANPIAYFDIGVGEEAPQRLEIELFESVVPKTVANFKALCTGEKGEASFGKPLHYKGSQFHRLIKEFMIQGGDIENANGTGGESIYGNKFEDENFTCSHLDRGFLAMANSGPNTNGSQFYITFKATEWLDGKHVVFGKVVKNLELLDTIEALPTGENDLPEQEIVIVDCGILEQKAVEVDLVPEGTQTVSE